MNPRFLPIYSLILLALLAISQSGCSGGNSGKSDPPPPASPSPQFFPIDAPGAGRTTFLGTTAQDINENGDIAGFFTDPNNASHGFLLISGQTVMIFDAPGAGTTSDAGTDSQGIKALTDPARLWGR